MASTFLAGKLKIHNCCCVSELISIPDRMMEKPKYGQWIDESAWRRTQRQRKHCGVYDGCPRPARTKDLRRLERTRVSASTEKRPVGRIKNPQTKNHFHLFKMYSKATLSLAVLAVARLALANPYCLLTAVNKFEHPADQKTLCCKEAEKVKSYISELCPSNLKDEAEKSFEQACKDAGLSGGDGSGFVTATAPVATGTAAAPSGSAGGAVSGPAATGSPITPPTPGGTGSSGSPGSGSQSFTGAATKNVASVAVRRLRNPPTQSQRRWLAFNASPQEAANTSAELRIPPYKQINKKFKTVRRVLGVNHALTLAEKILYSHLDDPEEALLSTTNHGKDIRGNATLKLKPDRVAMQDASAQMALLQFMSCGLPSTAVPTSIHCDHMIVGQKGADVDLPESIQGNKEVYDFLESAAKKYGIEFWPPGAGIIHQAVLENYASPGLMMLGTDSHTPNAGGLGAIAIGVGGADAVDAMVDAPWELKSPRILGVELKGALGAWATPKDIILKLTGILTVRGGTGFILEYFGKGLEALSCTGMATVCNMGAEVGATTSIFPLTGSMLQYLKSTNRESNAYAALDVDTNGDLLAADATAAYDEVITIDLSELEPHINGPFTPDLSTPLSHFKDAVKANQWPDSFGAGLIGSCTNSSYQDMTRAEELVKQASDAGLRPKADFFITPGSEQVRATLDRDSTLDTFSSAGGTILANACGPCIGQWKRTDGISKGDGNAILSSYNRNFKGRNDGNPQTMNFLASPEIVTAMSYSGSTTFNPITDTIPTPSGEPFRFSPPIGSDLPSQGFAQGNPDFQPTPAVPAPQHSVVISPTSERLAVLEPFNSFPEGELTNLRIIYKVKGQCTTDTISAAGPWLKYKGHLPNISANTLIGAVNAETGETNVAYDHFSPPDSGGQPPQSGIPQLAQKWKQQGHHWMVVAENNYGEGSAREHAALQPRYLGGRIVLAKSFARIHETNLKKQGIVPLTFETAEDYAMLQAGDVINTVGLHDMLKAGGKGEVRLKVRKREGGEVDLGVRHTISRDQASFILAGSALNLLAKRGKES
ncbi:uncharacterized protein KY384_006913 [Bacidia gigantensis]|uniref:uncharacterized protein n=1 Tax=Bacidia gigantensis TaxID=2732470 RepID=UPI001D05B9F8|nr:uncharacterized protein KY384_006913 [Bacidia gigantensis]KAG8527997.1 hypothetical protein KY384_006913 [Bacidia gigantensis]